LLIAPFDGVLLDAPCTNTGVMRRRIDVRWRLRPEDFSRMSNQQLIISRAVFRLLKPGGILVYSTCSLEREENEQVVRRLVAELPAMGSETEKDSLPFRDGFDGAFAAKLSAAGRSVSNARRMITSAVPRLPQRSGYSCIAPGW